MPIRVFASESIAGFNLDRVQILQPFYPDQTGFPVKLVGLKLTANSLNLIGNVIGKSNEQTEETTE
jgi:hypothetical protein